METKIDPFAETQQPSSLRLSLIFAAIMTAAMVLLQMLSRDTMEHADSEDNTGTILGVLNYVILLGLLIYFIVWHRDKNLHGDITYGKAFKSCFQTMVLYALFMSLVTYLWFSLDESLLDAIKSKSAEALEKNKELSTEKKEEALQMMDKFQTPLMFALTSVFTNILLGTVLSLIASAFNKTFRKSIS